MKSGCCGILGIFEPLGKLRGGSGIVSLTWLSRTCGLPEVRYSVLAACGRTTSVGARYPAREAAIYRYVCELPPL